MTVSHGSELNHVNDAEPNGVHPGQEEYQYPKHFLGKPRPVRVIIIGAGISGIAAVKLFKERFLSRGKPVELVLYEKNADVGGTWLENRYPGCACDVPAHAYGFSWEGNPRWSQAYVTALELFDYFKGRAKEYGVFDYVHLSHRVTKCEWNEKQGKWEVEVEDLEAGRMLTDEAEVVVNATGFLNKWKWPDIPGLDSFRGHLAHSARWDDSYDFGGKKVGIIGCGSSAIQIVPQIQPQVQSLVSFNRSSTWITPEFAAEFAPKGRETHFSEEQKDAWAKDGSSYIEYRKHVEASMNNFFDMQFKDSKSQKEAFQNFRATMKERLGPKGHLAQRLVPDFAVGCRRVTPGHNYLETLAKDNVTVETGSILKFTPTGIEMEDGTSHAFDAVICATGFDTSFRPSFPVIGDEGTDLRDVWAKEPRSYLSIAASGFPNFFIASGPNFPLANGTLIPCLERCVSYAFDAVSKIQAQGIKSMSPKSEAVDEFQEHKDAMMKDLVWTSGCRSWYKNGKVDGKVWGPWPGSSLHFLQMMSEPRWEDWNIKYLTPNRFQYMGNGKTEIEETGGDLSWYIREPGASCK